MKGAKPTQRKYGHKMMDVIQARGLQYWVDHKWTTHKFGHSPNAGLQFTTPHLGPSFILRNAPTPKVYTLHFTQSHKFSNWLSTS